jgi:hypothetical protein
MTINFKYHILCLALLAMGSCCFMEGGDAAVARHIKDICLQSFDSCVNGNVNACEQYDKRCVGVLEKK